MAFGFSRDRGENYVNFSSHIAAGDNGLSNHSKPCDKNNIFALFVLFRKDCENAKKLLCQEF